MATEKYVIDQKVERAIILLSCTSPRFYGRIGHALDIDAMPTPVAQRTIEAAHAVARSLGHGPDTPLAVIQQLNSWRYEGKVTHEEVMAVNDYLDQAEDEGRQPEETMIQMIAPILKRRLQSTIVHSALDEYKSKGDFSRVVSMINKAASLGESDTSIGVQVGSGSFAVIESMKYLQRLPTGIVELDVNLSGGLPRGQMGCAVGNTGDGKSMYLSHVSAYGTMSGLFVGIVTLELPPPIVLARVTANITGVPIDAIMEGSDLAKQILPERAPGMCVVKDMTPQVSTVHDVIEWVKMCEDQKGRKMDLLVVDYADKLSSGNKTKGDHGYIDMRDVYEGLRVFNLEREGWLWTASAGTAAASKKAKHLDVDHMADSSHKGRVVDVAITLNAQSDGAEMMFYIAKNRTGKSRIRVGPLPTDFACGAIAPVMRPSGPPGQEVGALVTEQALGDSPF